MTHPPVSTRPVSPGRAGVEKALDTARLAVIRARSCWAAWASGACAEADAASPGTGDTLWRDLWPTDLAASEAEAQLDSALAHFAGRPAGRPSIARALAAASTAADLAPGEPGPGDGPQVPVQLPGSRVVTYGSQAERDASVRLAEQRQGIAARNTLLPAWGALSDYDREMSALEARDWLRAAAAAGLLGPGGRSGSAAP